MSFLDRTDRSVLSLWWWTVDHKLLGLILLMVVGGVMLLMSAGAPVAISKGLNEYHFLKKQLLSIFIFLRVYISIGLRTYPCVHPAYIRDALHRQVAETGNFRKSQR